MDNNSKLKQYITKHEDRTTITATGTEIAKAGREDLCIWATQLGGNPQEIMRSEPATAPAPAPAPPSIHEALRVLADAASKTHGVDEEMVRDMIADQIAVPMEKLSAKVDALSPLAETLDKIAEAMKSTSSSRLPLAIAVSSGSNPILEMVAPFYKAGSPAPTKVCISAPPSYGKSYSISLLARSYDHSVVHGCSGDMDEWSMLLGACTPKSEGGFITVDGTLVEAVRSASEGKSTLLFLDEVFRMSPTTMESMLSFLAPQPDASGDLVYSITTKQNASGKLETLTCSVDKLHIVCATNLCEVQPPEAFLDRFLFKHVRYDKSMIMRIAQSVAERYAISESHSLASAFADTMGDSRGMHSSGQLLKPMSIRDLERGCIHASDASAMGVAEWIKDNGMDAMLMWSSDTGDIIADSDDGVKKLGDMLVRLVKTV